MVRKTRAKKTPTPSTPGFQSDRFLTLKDQETNENLHVYRKVWAERKVILDEVDLEIRRSFDRRGWLPFLDVDYPFPIVLIREFYLNLFVHSNDSNVQYVTSWIRGEEYIITLKVVASALHVPLVQQLVYPYIESLLSMTLCLTSLVLPFSGVLNLVSHFFFLSFYLAYLSLAHHSY